MIEFKCPHCSREIRVSDKAAGKKGTCHGCSQQVRIPVQPELVMTRTEPKVPAPIRVPCRFCGEEIAETAMKCKHCNEFQDGSSVGSKQNSGAPLQVNVSQHVANITHGRQWSGFLAVILSLIFPGLGQLYKGQVLRAILWIIFIVAGYILIIPGLILHLCCIIDAGVSDPNR